MNVATISRHVSLTLISAALLGTASISAVAQSRNSPYSPNPVSNRKNIAVRRPASDSLKNVVVVAGEERPEKKDAASSMTTSTTVPPVASGSKNTSLTDIYKIASGDLLLVNLKNSPQGPSIYTVRADGTIDYPLAGGRVNVAGRTADEVSAYIASSIKLFRDSKIEVKVHEYRSHSVIVTGTVGNGGEKYLRREAMPLYAVLAESDVHREANRVLIRRSGSQQTVSYGLGSGEVDKLLVYPGDRLEFVTVQTARLK